MKSIYQYLTIAGLYILLSTIQCANPINPSGGPRDTIPPLLINSEPATGTILFQEQELSLTFDEFISADKLRQNLIITPQTDVRYTPLTKKNTITITFEEPFADSITYTLNFFNGVTDITERNPAENLVLAFSTGPYIDSLSITGSIKDLKTQKPNESYLAALYPWTDTLDYTTDKPMYFATSDEDGRFAIDYIKAGLYKLLAFEDVNSNLLLESQTEPHGFLSDTLHLTTSLDSLTINTTLLDVRPLQLVSARPFGAYFQVRYNKPILRYRYSPITGDSVPLFSKLSDDAESIQFYPSPAITDSLAIILSSTDTTKSIQVDTLQIQFTNSRLRPEDFISQLSPTPGTTFRDTISFHLTFNKPILTYDSTRIRIQNDSLYSFTPTPRSTWNFNRTKISFTFPWSWKAYQDTLTNIITAINDSAQVNSTFLQQFQLQIDTGAFLSVQNDSSVSFNRTYKQFLPAETGSITYELLPDLPSAIVQLIDDKYETVKQNISSSSGTFRSIPPGKYSLRIVHDINQNGIWDFGNLYQDLPPEPVFVLQTFTELRANWEVNIPPVDINKL